MAKFKFELRDRVTAHEGEAGIVLWRAEGLSVVEVQVSGQRQVDLSAVQSDDELADRMATIRDAPPLPDPDDPAAFARELVEAEPIYTLLLDDGTEVERAERALALVA